MGDMYNKIESLCKARGSNITQMCRETNISRSVLSELKSGRTKQLSAKYLPVVADYLDVSVGYLLGNEEKPATDNDSELYELLEDIRRNPDLRAMFSLAKDATPEQVRQYINVIKAIRGENTDG
ncbi:MAG TPA: helix-turn-helix transcriptional regulator [Candidatus Onthovicinus excrementipullorum]|nr:helix-turn-helix transcriptional regulator [Candidatus Onthovicinus excrementipullorum]